MNREAKTSLRKNPP